MDEGLQTRPVAPLTAEIVMQMRRDFCDRFNLNFLEYGHHVLLLDDPRWPEMLGALEDLNARKTIGLRGRGACWLEEPPPRSSDPNVWFQLSPGSATFKSASRTPASLHFLWSDRQLCSQRFLDAVRNAGLTGLDFLPREETSAADPMPCNAVNSRGLVLRQPLI